MSVKGEKRKWINATFCFQQEPSGRGHKSEKFTSF